MSTDPKVVEQQEAFKKQMISAIGADTPLGKATLAEWRAQEERDRHPKTATKGSGTMNIPVEQIDDSPHQLRHEMGGDAFRELTRSIQENGLLSPILVRRKGDKYEAIFGHRRLAVYRHLQFEAKTEKAQKEREKYDFIAAQVVPDVTDEQMVLLGLTENLLREDLSPLDAAMGVLALKIRTPALNTAKKLSEKTGLQERKVERLLRLASSPEVVQQGVREGVEVPVANKPDDSSSEEKRTLDLLAALEFTRLHQALSKKPGVSKKKDSSAENGESSADKLTREAIAQALQGGWSFREIAGYVDKAVSKSGAPEAKKPPGRPRLPFKKTGQQLVIYYGRLKTLGKADLQSLRKALDEVLERLGLKAVPVAKKS